MIRTLFATLLGISLVASPLLAAEKAAVAAPADGNVFLSDATGKYAVDPICGMNVTVDAKTVKGDYDGKQYYFCSDGCSKKFAAAPAEAVAKLVLPAYILSMKGDKMLAACAVTREEVMVGPKTRHAVYKGHDYFFCCDRCPKKFDANPEKYALAVAAASASGDKAMAGGEKCDDCKPKEKAAAADKCDDCKDGKKKGS